MSRELAAFTSYTRFGNPLKTMKRKIMLRYLIACVVAMGAIAASAQTHATELTWDVALCVGCTSNSQFEAAARQLAGTSFNGEREVLVINPNSGLSKFVTIFNTPPGEDPWFVASSDSSKTSRALDRSGLSSSRTGVLLGSEVVLSADPTRAIYFAGDATPSVQSSSSSAYIRSATAQESLEIGALIEFGEDTLVMVLPNNGYFDTFTRREPAAVANYIYQKMTERNPGWAIETVSSRLRKLIAKRFGHFFGQTTQVCVIFNNGDSACFQPDAATPSAEHLVEGSAKTKDGTPIGSGGGGGGLPTSNDYLPNSAWGPAGGSGASGELWLFCAYSGSKLLHCWTEVL